MKLTITMKTPDCIENAIENIDFKDDDEKEEFYENAKRVCQRWFNYGEYLVVEVDLEKETIKVL